DHGATLARIKTCYDSAIPAGNSVAARNLVALTRLTGEAGYRESAERTLKTFSGQIVEIPRSVTNLAIAMVEFAALAPASEQSETERAPKGIPTVGGAAAGVPEFEGIVLVSGEAVDDDGSVKKKKEVATAQACLSVDRLPAGGTCQILVRFKLEEGWHANANPPSAENYIPTTLTIESALGCKLLDAKYPKGKPFKMEDTPEPVSVYEGAVEFRGMIEIPAEAAGKVDEMEIKVKYQACNAKTCLAPKVVSLKGKIAVAGPGETVKQINAKHFPVTAAAPSDR
ncbi:MAG TPA: protein-disulfide reductase DsbD domain-containing protein, partial [Planctomycetaceae bacterium]|nr:protein-disulfide reductase DsbD domain-containing protein [Planctomycetaceae bacterium]